MIDTLLKNLPQFKKPSFWDKFGLKTGCYQVVTLHRPSNVDDFFKLNTLLVNICQCNSNIPLVFPIHPRTKSKIPSNWEKPSNLHLVEPMGYFEFNYLVKNSMGVITDSGGITEETTVLGVPCLTLRTTTERPETVRIGTNVLIGDNQKKLKYYLKKLSNGHWKKGEIPELWDGNTALRIVRILNTIHKNEFK